MAGVWNDVSLISHYVKQQKSFRELIAGLTNEKVKDSVSKISCEVIELDGTISIQRNVEIIKKWIQL